MTCENSAMTCENLAQVHAYHDGELPAEHRAAFEAHLSTCADCRELLAELRQVSEMLATVPLPQMPDRSINRMYGSYWAAKQVQDRGIRRLAGTLTAAAAAIMLVVQFQSRPADLPAPQPPVSGSYIETVAWVPDNADPEFIQVAYWMANDLSMTEGQ